jgi:Caspase domain/PDZ domain
MLVAAICVQTLSAHAQTNQRGIGTELNQQQAAPPPATITELPGKQKRWALVIGVDQYQDAQIGRLSGAANDARTLANALTIYAGFPADQVILLATDQPQERQPTRVNILRRLSNLATVVPKDGLLLVSFAGHGMERNGQAFLLPSDAQIADDISFLEDTAISVTRMKERIKTTGVGQVLVLLDACRNDPGGRADAPNLLTPAYQFNFDVRNREVQAFATIYATAVGQRAYEYSEKQQGYFTWALVEGLKGGAANEKGEVTLANLVAFVQETVTKRIGIDLGAGRQQQPFAMIEGYKAEDLIVAASRKDEQAGTVGSPPSRPVIGLSLADIPPQLAARPQLKTVKGVWVEEVLRTGIAFDAGLRAGDIILSVNGTAAKDLTEYQRIVNALKIGDTVVLKVLSPKDNYRTAQEAKFTFKAKSGHVFSR